MFADKVLLRNITKCLPDPRNFFLSFFMNLGIFIWMLTHIHSSVVVVCLIQGDFRSWGSLIEIDIRNLFMRANIFLFPLIDYPCSTPSYFIAKSRSHWEKPYRLSFYWIFMYDSKHVHMTLTIKMEKFFNISFFLTR